MEYNKKVVCDYIKGNDITYNIEDLENNPKFMLEVIKESQDKRMYNLCYDRVKGNYDLVKYLITNFSDDLNFCDTVFDNYIKNKENDDNDIEFTLIMYNNAYSVGNSDLIMKYGICKESAYMLEMAKIERVKSLSSKERFRDEIGLGYFVLQDHYGFNNIILDFFSKRMLDDIFYKNPKLSFEEIIHNNFRKKEDLEKFGINSFIISYVRIFDKYLADHLASNVELIRDVNKDIKKVINRWDSYMKKINDLRYDILLQ